MLSKMIIFVKNRYEHHMHINNKINRIIQKLVIFMDRHDLRMCLDMNIIGNFGLFKGYFRN